MLYISVSQNTVADENEEVKELMEVVHISINLVSSDAEADMMSWNIVHRGRDHAEGDRPHPERDALLWT